MGAPVRARAGSFRYALRRRRRRRAASLPPSLASKSPPPSPPPPIGLFQIEGTDECERRREGKSESEFRPADAEESDA